MNWAYKINLLASGTYPWVPCTEEEAQEVNRTGSITLACGIRMPAVARNTDEMTPEELA